jgi:glucose-1-phosphate cytidylyltransferase
LLGYPYENFWCMDTFKDQQQLTDLYNAGCAPWEVWKNQRVAESAV